MHHVKNASDKIEEEKKQGIMRVQDASAISGSQWLRRPPTSSSEQRLEPGEDAMAAVGAIEDARVP